MLEHSQQVQLIPMLDELSVMDTPDVDAAHGDPVSGRGNAQEQAGVGCRVRVSADDPVARRYEDRRVAGGTNEPVRNDCCSRGSRVSHLSDHSIRKVAFRLRGILSSIA